MLLCSPRPGLQAPDSMMGKEISKPTRGRDRPTKANRNLPEAEAKVV